MDASQLENAILNLCINSRDAMPDGGRIIIETANQWLDAEAALANDLPAGEYLSLTVTDTGTTDVLGDLGYTLIEAADSLTGLKLLQSDVGIDLLITDVGLPGGMNGRQMADAGREVRPGLKTLFITGYAESAALGNSSLGAGMQVLTKPFSIDILATRVLELLRG